MRLKSTVLLIAIYCCVIQDVLSQKLSAHEKKIISNVNKNMDECFRLLEQTVNINSGTLNKEGIEEVGKIYQDELKKLGFDTRIVALPKNMNRGAHLFAEKKGTKGKKVLLIGHIDTVFEPHSPFQKYVNQDTIAIGPGTMDMKGGNLILLFALKSLYQAGLLKDTQIIVALHGDEENPGAPIDVTRLDIIEAAKRSDVALAFENGTGFETATIARRGASSWRLEVKGKQAHSQGVFSDNVGAGAIYEASRILNRFYNELQEEYLTFNAGLIAGGTAVKLDSTLTESNISGKTNIVANSAVVIGDIRFLTEEQLEKVRTKMRAIVAENLPHTSATITFKDGIPSMPPKDGNMKLLNMYSRVSMDLGLGEVKPYDPGKRGAGDISFVAKYVDCLDGIGAMGGNAHAPQEWVDLRTFDEQIKRAAIMIYRLTR